MIDDSVDQAAVAGTQPMIDDSVDQAAVAGTQPMIDDAVHRRPARVRGRA
jgi:hypothetical protein